MAKTIEKDLNEHSIIIMIPIFNDWESLEKLLTHLDLVIENTDIIAKVIVLDDASVICADSNLSSLKLRTLKKVEVLKLRRNLGHQRAIAIGLAYIEEKVSCKAVIVMDGDGEDDPKDVLRLIEKCSLEKYRKVIFAKRTKRSESLQFKTFYLLYKLLYKLLTGQEISVGNFSLIPYELLRRVVIVSELWNHYAAALMKARIPYTVIASRRSPRLAGISKMNFVSLVTHGLSAISVYGDVVGVRLLVATCLLIIVTLVGIITIVFMRLATDLAIPGWASYMVSLLFVILMQAIMASLIFIFIVLSGRNYSNFLPKRDYHYFILELQEIFKRV